MDAGLQTPWMISGTTFTRDCADVEVIGIDDGSWRLHRNAVRDDVDGLRQEWLGGVGDPLPFDVRILAPHQTLGKALADLAPQVRSEWCAHSPPVPRCLLANG